MQNYLYLPERTSILAAVSKAVVGKEDVVELLLVALLSEGHVLLEGPPGSAKTLLCKTFASAMGGDFKRVQCTPDMLPADITGFYMYRPDADARFVPGPVFTNILMIDELNRATPRTQSAFLEAMAERQVTLEGVRHPLPPPFMVVASQVPVGSEGTFHLPTTQTDRFMFRLWVAYPEAEEESKILTSIDDIEAVEVQPVLTLEELFALRRRAKEVYVAPEVVDYIVALCERLRRMPDVSAGPSPRASIALYKGARALAFIDGRNFVLPDDVKRLAAPALDHRLLVRPEAEADGVVPADLIREVLEELPVPK